MVPTPQVTISNSPANNTRAAGICPGNVGQRGSRPLRGKRGAEPFVFCTQERDNKKTSHFGHVSPKPVNTMSKVQNDYHPSGETSPSTSNVHDLNRSQRRILACPNCQYVQEIPCLQPGYRHICVCGYAVWPQCGTSNIHQIMCSNFRRPENEGNRGVCISGRLASSRHIRTRVLHRHKSCSRYVTRSGLSYKSEEVQSHSFPVPGLDRVEMEHEGHGFYPQEKVINLKKSISNFASQNMFTRRQLERQVGLINWASTVNPVSKVMLKFIHSVQRSLARTTKDRDLLVPMTTHLRNLLSFWIISTPTADWSRPIKDPDPSITVTTDASLDGWGFHTSEGKEGRGTWSQYMRSQHINILEFMAAWIAIKSLKAPTGTSILLQSDNTTVVNCLKRGGSARSLPLNKITLWVVKLVTARGWFLSAVHIQGAFNVRADLLSRGRPVSTEWTLHRASVLWLCRQTSILPQVDLFATPFNARFPSFLSPIAMKGSSGVDALSTDWNQWERIYLFPPFPLISEALARLERFRGSAILIAPWWPNRPWFPRLSSMAKEVLTIPDPTVFQVVGGRTHFAPSCVTSKLRGWIFSN